MRRPVWAFVEGWHDTSYDRPDADGIMDVFDEFLPDVRRPRCVSRLGVDRPGILVSTAFSTEARGGIYRRADE